MKMPTDISKEFEGSWEAFNELPVVPKLEPLVREEAFRILLKQAKINVRYIKGVKDFISVNTKYNDLIKRVNLAFMLYHLLPQQHRFGFILKEDKMVNVVHSVTVKGEMKLKPNGLQLKYLLERMYTLKVFRDKPVQLFGDKFRSMPSQLRAYDFVTLFASKDLLLQVARIKRDYLVLRYEVYFDGDIPNYMNIDKQLHALWRRASLGDFK